MNIEIDNIRLIEDKYIKDFELKTRLTEIECYGLELVLIELAKDYYESMGVGEGIERPYNEVRTFTRHLEDCLDVLDGINDTFYIGEYKVTSVYLTVNDIVVLKCLKEECDYYEGNNSIYFATIN